MSISISVVIPCFNSVRTIEQTLNSVFAQTYPVFEVILIDDGSTDRTSDMVNKYFPKVDIITQTNGGPSKARNTGIRHARGNFIAFLDSDDFWYPDKLKIQASILGKYPNVFWSYTGFEIKNNNHKKIKSFKYNGIYNDALDLLKVGFSPNSSTIIVKRELFNNVNLFFDEKYQRSEDREVWLKIACKYPNVAVIGNPLAVYIKGEGTGLTATAFQEEDFSFLTMKKRLFDISNQIPAERKRKLEKYIDQFNKKAIIQIWSNSVVKSYPFFCFDTHISRRLNFYMKHTYRLPAFIKKVLGSLINFISAEKTI